MAFTLITQGSFKSAGVGVKIPVPQSADYFKTVNLTQMALAAPTACVAGEWWGGGLVNPNSGLRWRKAASSAILIDAFSTATVSNGFTYVTVAPFVEAQAPAAITAITAANPAVVTQANTYTNGDILRLYGTTGMPMIGGMAFEISSVSGAGYTLLGLPATASNGFAAAATAGFTRRLSPAAAVDPEFMYITNISQAIQAVVSTSVDPSRYYVVGMKIHFSVPSSFGMSQISQLTGKIVAVNAVAAAGNIGAYNVTVDIDTTAFTAFSFPAAALSPVAPLFATFAPAGQSTQQDPITGVYTGYDITKAPFHTSQFTPYMFLAAGANSPAGSVNDSIVWQAFKMETTQYGSGVIPI